MTPDTAPEMRSLDIPRLLKLLGEFGRVRLLVVGDSVLDEYLEGEVERLSPEAPVPVVQVVSESTALGGAANVVRNVRALGGECSFCTAVGDDDAGRAIARLLAGLGVDPKGVIAIPGRPTTRKTRVVARGQQLARLDREDVAPIAGAAFQSVLAAMRRSLDGVHGAVLADYSKGLFAGENASAVMEVLAAKRVPVAVDPKGQLSPYRGAALLKPNLREAEALTGVEVRQAVDLDHVAERLREAVGDADVAITLGGRGMSLFSPGRPRVDVPTATRQVYDVQGAGDTAIAGLVLALRAGATLPEAGVLANAAAGVVVGKRGTATASPQEVREMLPAALAAALGRVE